MPYCPNCGIDTADDKKFCRRCGVSLLLPDEDAATMNLPANTAPTEPNRPTMPVTQNPTVQNPGVQGPPAGYAPPVNYYPPAQTPQYEAPQYQSPQYQGPQYQSPQYQAPLQPYPPAPRPEHTHISLGDWLSGGWHVYKENWFLMTMSSLLGAFLSLVTVGILAGPLLMGLFNMAFKTMRGERPQLGDMFNWHGRFLQAFLAFLISAALYGGVAGIGQNSALGAVLSFVVTPFLTLMLGFTLSSILERRMDVAAAVNDIGKLIFSKDAFMWWIVGLVFATIIAGGFFGFCIGLFVTLPWIISSAAVAYRDIQGIDDPNRTLH